MKILISAGTYYFIKKGIKYSETAYALQIGGCKASCKFCTQSILSKADKTFLSRVKWYPVELDEVSHYLSKFTRFCLQTVIKDGFEEEALEILKRVNTKGKSITTTPVSLESLIKFKEAGVDYLGVGLDTVKSLWDYVGKPYTFDEYMKFIKDGIKVFGKGHVYVHLIVGLGESDEELIGLMKNLYEIGAEVALFAFTPIKGTPFENLPPPPLERYRRIQMIRQQLAKKDIKFYFLTSGCPSCDRPYYNESPTDKDLYNVPLRDLKWYSRSE